MLGTVSTFGLVPWRFLFPAFAAGVGMGKKLVTAGSHGPHRNHGWMTRL